MSNFAETVYRSVTSNKISIWQQRGFLAGKQTKKEINLFLASIAYHFLLRDQYDAEERQKRQNTFDKK